MFLKEIIQNGFTKSVSNVLNIFHNHWPSFSINVNSHNQSLLGTSLSQKATEPSTAVGQHQKTK